MCPEALNKGIDQELFEKIISINRVCNYHNMLKIDVAALAPGESSLMIHVEERHINPQSVAHGGVTFSLVDTAMGMAIRTHNTVGVTVEININYVKPVVQGDTIYSTGRVVSLGKKIIIAQGDVTNQNGELIAISRGTYYNRGKKLVNQS